MTLIQKREKTESSVETCTKSPIEQFFDPGFAPAVKTRIFIYSLYILAQFPSDLT